MNNLLRQIEIDDDIFIVQNTHYEEKKIDKFLEIYDQLKREEKIKSTFEDEIWICNQGIKHAEITFTFNEYLYATHTEKLFGIKIKQMQEMLKCYAIYMFGKYIFRTIGEKIKVLREFLEHYSESDYKITQREKETIADFLGFIGTPQRQGNEILMQLPVRKEERSGTRQLSHLINYLAIDNELTELYDMNLSEEEFVHWFPLYFWAKITFVLPLRATEMLVTPWECLEYRDNKIYLKIRRTNLKKGMCKVWYEVERDYKIFKYRVPKSKTIEIIEKYKKVTGEHKRKYLFNYNKYFQNNVFSLQAFNDLLKEFIELYLIGNKKYDYAKFASGIQEFEVVTAGDSRPIAMANLFYQNTGADICRQLADHTNLKTSAGYYTNVSNTVLASSIMQLQRKLNYGYSEMKKIEKTELRLNVTGACTSPRQPRITGDLSDCIAEECLEECLKCRYYFPSETELKKELEIRKKKLDDASIRVIEGMDGVDAEKLFLDAHTGITRYKIACDINAEEKLKKWQRHRNSTTSC